MYVSDTQRSIVAGGLIIMYFYRMERDCDIVHPNDACMFTGIVAAGSLCSGQCSAAHEIQLC